MLVANNQYDNSKILILCLTAGRVNHQSLINSKLNFESNNLG